jgi:chaperonin GroES
MNVTPISDVVIIRRQEQNTVSGGGIVLPYADELREDIGTVMFVGRGKPHKCKKCAGTTHIPMQVAVGDRVIFSTNGHQITKVNGEELIVLRQDSIIAVIEDEEEVSSARGLQQVQEFYVSGEK